MMAFLANGYLKTDEYIVPRTCEKIAVIQKLTEFYKSTITKKSFFKKNLKKRLLSFQTPMHMQSYIRELELGGKRTLESVFVDFSLKSLYSSSRNPNNG